jgi:hypothetical protein
MFKIRYNLQRSRKISKISGSSPSLQIQGWGGKIGTDIALDIVSGFLHFYKRTWVRPG